MPQQAFTTYNDGTPVRLGDRVKLGDEMGIVAFVIDTGNYADAFPQSSWGYIQSGFMVEFECFGLVHYTTPEEDLEFVSRAVAKQPS